MIFTQILHTFYIKKSPLLLKTNILKYPLDFQALLSQKLHIYVHVFPHFVPAMLILVISNVYYQGEFPTMLHDPKEMWQVGDYQLQVEQTQQYGVWLRHSTLTITSKVSNVIDFTTSRRWLLQLLTF